ncbi:MAG: flagellar hook-length control protein FliK [Marinicaulis sp.]|nr:flagellar hook-length control protein FliK [Marinicaulis sp.]
MSDVGLLIEATMQDAVAGLKKPVITREDAAHAFSFASAVTALEGRAAQSLETHGAAPQNASVGKQTGGQQSETTSTKTTTPAQQSAASTSDPASSKSALAQQSTSPQANPTQATTLAAPIAQSPAQASAAIAATATGAAAVQTAHAAKADAALRPTIDVRAPFTSKLARPEALAKAPPSVQDFAKFIARRLDSGASVFELRLDPPSLGRVEAQMKVADDGETKLSLKFDNQTALDMFSRDETDLRQSLADAGFALGRDRLELILKEDAAPSFETGDDDALTPENYARFGYSQGVIDLTI